MQSQPNAERELQTERKPERMTLAVLAFRQAGMVEEAVRAALAQTGVILEIILSDDASEDGTFERMQALAAEYRGPHRLVLNRNPVNLGLIAHVNKIFDMASADLLVLAAGDDVSLPQRCQRLLAVFDADPGCVAAHSDVLELSEQGVLGERNIAPIVRHPMSAGEVALSGAIHIGATAAYRRSSLKVFGPITELEAFEDLIFGFRATLLGGLRYLPEVLVHYRVGVGLSHQASDRAKKLRRRAAVARQRLADAKALPKSTDTLSLVSLLQGWLSLTEAKLLAEQSRARAAAHCLRGGIFKVARAVVAEQRLMRRMKAAPPA